MAKHNSSTTLRCYDLVLCAFISASAVLWFVGKASNAGESRPTVIQTRDQAIESDENEKIRALLTEQVERWNAGDLEGFMHTYWQSENLTFSSGGQITRGWQQTLDRYRQRYGAGQQMGTLGFSELEITVLGDSAAMVLGNWHLERGGEKMEGLFTLVLRKFDNDWRIIHDHTSLRPDEDE